MGRFINVDGLIGETGDLLAHNMYAYCQNNPVMMVDPSGELGVLAFAGIMAVGGLVSAGVNIVFQLGANGGDFNDINWMEVGGAFVGSSIASIPLPGMNLAIAMGLGTAGNLASGLINGSVISLSSAGIALGLGAAGGGIGFGVGKLVGKLGNKTSSVTSKMLKKYPATTQSYPWNLAQYTNAQNGVANQVTSSIVRGTSAGTLSSQSFTEYGNLIIDFFSSIQGNKDQEVDTVTGCG